MTRNFRLSFLHSGPFDIQGEQLFEDFFADHSGGLSQLLQTFEFAGRLSDCFALLVGRLRERKGFETGSRRVTESLSDDQQISRSALAPGFYHVGNETGR